MDLTPPKTKIANLIDEIGAILQQGGVSPSTLMGPSSKWKNIISALASLLAWARNQRSSIDPSAIETLKKVDPSAIETLKEIVKKDKEAESRDIDEKIIHNIQSIIEIIEMMEILSGVSNQSAGNN